MYTARPVVFENLMDFLNRFFPATAGGIALFTLLALFTPATVSARTESEPVSYYHDVRPVFQANCHGCHQPAKAKGDFVMTTFEALIKGGETGATVVPNDAAASYLFENITLVDGQAEMPPKGDPLTPEEVALVERWINEGAIDDTPANAVVRYSPKNPPVYHRAPLIGSLDFSPDGRYLAVAGFHEVLLHKADGSGLLARFVGLSEKITRVAFSPDGSKLAVTGGLPARMGELQIWDVEKRELDRSLPIGHDTIYGASWSPDGKQVAFGMADNTVRAIDVRSGKQVFFMGSHNDWVLDTVFDQTGEHLISVGRDMSTKLSHVATERFIDNLTSITPGALKGGIAAVALHPEKNHILVGGSDGVPQIYRTKRETVRKIGDNANLIRQYPPMPGRVWSVAFHPDGSRFVAGSSLDGKGAIHLYRSQYDATITPQMKKAMEKVAARRTPEEKKMLADWRSKGAENLHAIPVDAPVYAVAWSPGAETVVAAGQDGLLRFIDPDTGEVRRAIPPIAIEATLVETNAENADEHPPVTWEEASPRQIVGLDVSPERITIEGSGRYQQLVVTASLADGSQTDITRVAQFDLERPIVELTPRARVIPKMDGTSSLNVSLAGQSVSVPVEVTGLARTNHPDWIRDVNPVISKMGCNAGTCHGAKDGKAGFKLSLRGYDPLFDVRAFTDDVVSRRVNFASADDSLMLLKMTAGVPHEGGQLAKQHSTYYNIVRDWIDGGAKLNMDSHRVAHVELIPKNPVVQEIGARQQFRVVATYQDGTRRDVTGEAFVESGNTEVAKHDDHALLSTIRRGEAPILARYEGAYAATTLTVMGNRDGFAWEEPPAHNRIDELVAAKWKRMRIKPSGLSDDATFVRRVHLDLTGLPPSPETVSDFLADSRPTREKREELVERLIGSPAFVDHWANKWSDMLQVNSKFLGREGARLFRNWIHEQIAANTPYDQFVHEILTATGSNKENPAASYYKILRDPDMIMENTTHLFLATRFNCNKCHDHPFERWTQDQYYETAAFFARVDLERDKKNAPKQNIGGTAVEDAKPLFEVVSDQPEGEITHDRTGAVTPPAFPYPAETAPVSLRSEDDAPPTRREALASWITSPDNPYFASSYVNRIWGYLLGTGIIEPLDDIRAGNPPSNPELLNHLTSEFVNSGFDVRHLMRLICQSRTYQLSIETNPWNEDDTINFSHAKAKRLPAEVLYDAVHFVTGATPNIPGVGKGVRASQLPDAQIDLKSGFLANLGRPPRESACECERNHDLQMSAVLAFLSGPAIADAVASPDNDLADLVEATPDDRQLVEEIYLRVLSRLPSEAETEAALSNLRHIERDHNSLTAQLQERESWWIPVEEQRELERLKTIAAAANELETYLPDWSRKRDEAAAAQAASVAKAKAALDQIEEDRLTRLGEWESTLAKPGGTTWHPLHPTKAVSTDETFIPKILDAGSVLISSTRDIINEDGDWVVDFEVDANQPITGLMVEALPHESLPAFGPGLSKNGNFVVTEVILETAEPDAPDDFKRRPFNDARTEHIQKDFNLKLAYDGNTANQKAWAIGGRERQIHRARFQLKQPISANDGTRRLRVRIANRFVPRNYPLGHFRIWVTEAPTPLEAGAPASVAAALAKTTDSRSAEEQDRIVRHYLTSDGEWSELLYAWRKEQRPLPRDPKLVALERALAEARNPIKQDPQLLQLRQDHTYSTKQLENRRLTASQDLVWALVNSPAFLFSY